MAEFTDIGKHCSQVECKHIDFLPISCKFCKQTFCRDHAFSDNHNCPSANKVVERRGKIETFKCSFLACINRELCHLECSGCGNHFCLTHRYPNTHNCPSFEPRKEHMPQTTKIVEQIQEKASKMTTNKPTKNTKMALQVQLMKLKQKAVGQASIPATERLFFLVSFNDRKEERGIFVSRLWSVGKAVDTAAELCGVVNNNHKLSAPKLKLYKGDSVLSDSNDTQMSEIVESGVLSNGESLVLR